MNVSDGSPASAPTSPALVWPVLACAFLVLLLAVLKAGLDTDPRAGSDAAPPPIAGGASENAAAPIQVSGPTSSPLALLAAGRSSEAPAAEPVAGGTTPVAGGLDAGQPGGYGADPCGTLLDGTVDAASTVEYVDTFRAVEFRVVRTKDTGRVTFLNSHDPYQGHFYVAVFPGDYEKFPASPATHFDGKCIVVQGVIELYRGTPQIVLRSPDDVRVLSD